MVLTPVFQFLSLLKIVFYYFLFLILYKKYLKNMLEENKRSCAKKLLCKTFENVKEILC